MSIYNAFNEPQNVYFTLPLNLDDITAIAAASAEGAAQGAPDVPTYINFYFTYLGEMDWTPNFGNLTRPTPEDILKAILEKDIPFDDIGLEFYNDPSIDFGIYSDTIDHFSQFDKNIFISELSFNGNWRDGTGDASESEWAEYAFTIAFAKPQVTGVVWIPGNGTFSPAYLFQEDGSPRPALNTLSELFHSWISSGSAATNEQGGLGWRGFFGEYTLSWTSVDGKPESATFHLSPDGQNEFTLKPSSCAAAAGRRPRLPFQRRKWRREPTLPWLAAGIGAGVAAFGLIVFLILRNRGARK